MSTHAEDVMNRRNTLAYIRADSREIVFQRWERTVLPNGGTERGPTQYIGPFLVRKSTNKMRFLKPVTDNTSIGQMERKQERLVALHDADIQKNDVFSYDGEDYLVTKTEHKPYELICEVELTGNAPHWR